MKRKIQETFDMIHADEKLKDRTREFLAEAAGSSRGREVPGGIPPFSVLRPRCALRLLFWQASADGSFILNRCR